MNSTMSYSAYKTYYTCPRKYYISYRLRWEPMAVPSYFVEGRLFHLAAGMHAMGRSLPEITRAIRKEAEKARSSALSPREHERITVQEGMIAGMITAFAAVRGRQPYGKVEPDDLEQWVSSPDARARVVGKIDLWNRAKGLIVDWKTTYSLDPDYIAAERVSMQYYLYGILTDLDDCPPKKLLVEVVAKPNLRLKARETMPEFITRIADTCRNLSDSMIARIEIPWNEKARATGNYYLAALQSLGVRLQKTREAADFWPVTSSCNVFNLCEFFPICSKSMTSLPAKPPMGFRIRKEHN